jgi:hypothetical protein
MMASLYVCLSGEKDDGDDDITEKFEQRSHHPMPGLTIWYSGGKAMIELRVQRRVAADPVADTFSRQRAAVNRPRSPDEAGRGRLQEVA